jgi:hypothetical protein
MTLGSLLVRLPVARCHVPDDQRQRIDESLTIGPAGAAGLDNGEGRL